MATIGKLALAAEASEAKRSGCLTKATEKILYVEYKILEAVNMGDYPCGLPEDGCPLLHVTSNLCNTGMGGPEVFDQLPGEVHHALKMQLLDLLVGRGMVSLRLRTLPGHHIQTRVYLTKKGKKAMEDFDLAEEEEHDQRQMRREERKAKKVERKAKKAACRPKRVAVRFDAVRGATAKNSPPKLC